MESKYYGRIQFAYLDADDPPTQDFQRSLGFYYQPELYLLDREVLILACSDGRLIPSEAGVSVTCGVSVGSGVFVSVGCGVMDAGMEVSVRVGWGVSVKVGTRVSVGLGTRVLVGVRDGVRDGIRDAVGVPVNLDILVRVGGTEVQVTNGLVGVMYAIAVREGGMDAVSVGIGVGIYSEICTAVSAAAVLMGLEKAESTISCAPILDALGVRGFARAAAETMQIRLNPSIPAPRTVSGPEYSRIFTLVTWPYQL